MQIIKPKDKKAWIELRVQDITSTEVSALFGLSPYCTKFELWHRKKRGDIVQIEENVRMKWGTRLQDAIAEQIAVDNGWKVRRMDEYIRDEEIRAGASFDFEIESDGILEIKNVDNLIYRDNWIEHDDGRIEAPPHIEMQVQHQLLCSGRKYAYIGVLIGGNKDKLIKRTRDEYVIDAIRQSVSDFWLSIENNNPPKPDFVSDASFISKLYGYAEPNKVLDIRGDDKFLTMAQEYKKLGDEIKEREQKRDAIKAQFLTHINDAEKVTGDGFTISAGVVSESEISYTRSAYRMFKINWSKKK